MTTEIHGHVEDGYGPVADAFRSNFEERRELGAAFALRVDGELVVDIWGGVADKRTGAAWQTDTLQLVFSTSKGIAAVCLGILVRQGKVDLAEKVATYWPEFAANGKADITVAQMMSHQAGLAALDEKPAFEDILAVTPMVEALAAQKPIWEPGAAHGYHALTYGWLTAELCRRADGRRLNQILQDEVCEPLGVEAWFGLPESEETRVARLQSAGRPTGEELEFMRKVAGPGTLGGRALTLDGAMLIAGKDLPWNTREVHATEMPGANAITNARSLATIYAATFGEVDGVRLFDDATLEAFRTEQASGPDECLVTETRYGVGFWLDNELSPMLGDGSFGHPGAGGSLGYADPEAGVGYGYVMNQMGGGIAGDPRSVVLNHAVRACL